MGIFSKKLNSDEYEKLLKRIVELETERMLLSEKYDILFTSMSSLRGFVNRKVNSEEKEESIKSDLPFPFRGA
jgi:hypothetical protein